MVHLLMSVPGELIRAYPFADRAFSGIFRQSVRDRHFLWRFRLRWYSLRLATWC